MFTINCKGKLLVTDQPLVMGIINVTPDSFYGRDSSKGKDELLQLAGQMLSEGAAILDVGGQSSRPGSIRIIAEEEMERVLPVISAIHHAFPNAVISTDTYHSLVAKEAIHAGASIVNDISAGNLDAGMIPLVASMGVPYICMHMRGRPETMQTDTAYEDVVKEVLDFFIEKISACKTAGIKDLIIDPGFGFGKSVEQNFRLLRDMHLFGILEKPILAGLSRKSMIYKTLGSNAEKALNGTTALNMLALQNGANILRVHDVKEAVECVKLYQVMKNA